MKYIKFQEWFYGLPIWAEIDNFTYFGMASICIYLVEFKDKSILVTALVTALIMKGKGRSIK